MKPYRRRLPEKEQKKREARVVALRKLGYTYRRIATAVDMNVEAVFTIVKRGG